MIENLEKHIPLWDGWKKHFHSPPVFSTLRKKMSKRISAIKLRSKHQNTPHFVQPGVKNHAGLDFHSVTSPNPLKQAKNLIFHFPLFSNFHFFHLFFVVFPGGVGVTLPWGDAPMVLRNLALRLRDGALRCAG